MENKTKVWYNPAIIELRRTGQRRIERALELVAVYSEKHSKMPYLPSSLRTRFEIWAGSPLTSPFDVFRALKRCLVWHKDLYAPSDDDIQNAINRQLSKSAAKHRPKIRVSRPYFSNTAKEAVNMERDKPRVEVSRPKVSNTVKEAVKNGQKCKTRKTPIPVKTRAIRNCIPSYEKGTEDYIDGVKYRVIVYFGRNFR